MKKKIVKAIISGVLVAAISVAAFASVLILKQAQVELFSARIEQNTLDENAPALYLKSYDIDVGQYLNIVREPVVLPILDDTRYDPVSSTWVSSDGRSPVEAEHPFVVSARNGDVENVKFHLEVSGDISAIKALEFGVSAFYSSGAGTVMVADMMDATIDGARQVAISRDFELANGIIRQDEELTVTVNAWVNQEALSRLGEYNADGSFTITIVFES